MDMMKQAYVLYANDTYFDIVSMCAKSIRQFSDVPIIVYMLNSDKRIPVTNTKSVRWNCNIDEFSDEGMYHDHMSENNFYINRSHNKVYNLLIQRPLVVKNALINYADVVVYVDCDSVATPYVDRLFDMYDINSVHPYITEGIYSHLVMDGKGGVEYEETLEYNACELFGTNQKYRRDYRTTNIFVAGTNTIPFLEEWYWMCTHPAILKDFKTYAPFHEETIVNVLLWKNNYQKGLPYVYVNADVEKVDRVFNRMQFTGDVQVYGEWFKVPGKKEDITFFHGEKRVEEMQKMLNIMTNKLNVLFLAPHLSTGGMPAFLLKRIQALGNAVNIYVVEHSDVSPDYVVQKNQIKQLVKNFWTLGDDKLYLLKIIEANNIDIVHIDDVGEAIDNDLAKQLYRNDRTWRIVETCHNVAFNPDVDKVFHPDAYAFCTPYHEKTFANVVDYSETIEFPIDRQFKQNKKTGIVLNVGLWTPGKNQAEGIEIARKNPDLEFYFVGNQAPNFQDYWKPLMKDLPENVTIWGERDDVDEFMKIAEIFMFNSTWECNPLALREAISYGLPIIARNLPQYGDMFTKYLQPIDTDLNTIQANYEIPTDNTSDVFGKRHVNFYNSVVSLPIKQKISPNRVTIGQHFIEQPFLEILGNSSATYDVKFYDGDKLYHHDRIKANHWVRLSRRYYTKWRTEVWENDTLIYENTLNLSGKRVFITFDSESLGDTIAWIPYCLEFKKKHDCHVIVSTFKNFLFKEAYPELEFVQPGTSVPNIYAQYKLGWFYNNEYEPALPNTINLQQTATNILGLDYQEIIPRIAFTPSNNYYGRYVTIATNSTAGCKFWTKEGWQEVINHLVNKGYKVVNISKERNPFENCIQLDDVSMENTMNVIHHSDFFIGLSSGLSWLAWAMNKKVVMISNFTDDNHEFECIRITNKSVCHGCWNNPNFRFDKGDWNWCPVHKNTSRQFECHVSITSNMVVDKIKNLL